MGDCDDLWMGDRLVSTLDHMPEPETVRRLEVITGTGRRRRFSDDFKARIVEGTLAPGAVVSAVARRHGLTPQQVFTWRRQAYQPAATSTDTEAPLLVPVVMETPERTVRDRHRHRTPREDCSFGIVEVELDGARVRVGRGADAKTVAAVLRALKAGT